MKCLALLMDAPIALILVALFLFSVVFSIFRKNKNIPRGDEGNKFDKSNVLDAMDIILASDR